LPWLAPLTLAAGLWGGHYLNQPQNNLDYAQFNDKTYQTQDVTFPTRDYTFQKNEKKDDRDSSFVGLAETYLAKYDFSKKVPMLKNFDPDAQDPAVKAEFQRLFKQEFDKDPVVNGRKVDVLKDFMKTTADQRALENYVGVKLNGEGKEVGFPETVAHHFDSFPYTGVQAGLHTGPINTPHFKVGPINIGSDHDDPINIGLLEHYKQPAQSEADKFFADNLPKG
jgi:hypothetical protein